MAAMGDKPILFSGPMVRALLAGAKTQTRRVLKVHSPESVVSFDRTAGKWMSCEPSPVTGGTRQMDQWQSTRYRVGDRLYVREHWRTGGALDHLAPRDLRPEWAHPIEYYADQTDDRTGRFRQGMHMPRWASRLTLTVTDVRVQRLQDCTAVDALAEGVSSTDHWRPEDVDGKPFEDRWWDDLTFWSEYPQLAYRELWEAINGSCSWEANPWVAAYTFTVQHGNIDRLAE